jgi:hypothetical protein
VAKGCINFERRFNVFVPVVDSNNNPLMPTTPSRARRWVKERKATYFWKKGVYCVRLNVEPSDRKTQDIVVGIDPGSKREGLTVKSESHTYLNIQANAVDWVKDAVEVRRNMRRSRRFRNTPCRKNKSNRSKSPFPPSTKARWAWKLRLCNWLNNMFPVTDFIVEDIKARTFKGARKWNKSFSPLEVGKKWFYFELSKLGKLYTKQGYETKELRDAAGLKKTKAKLSDRFDAHCVDSWVLANHVVGGHLTPDNERILKVIPLRFHRRQLHALQPSKGGVRRSYGGTRSLGFKRGSLVRHVKYGVVYVGGVLKDRISLHALETGSRICQNAKISDCNFLTFNTQRAHLLPDLKVRVSDAN